MVLSMRKLVLLITLSFVTSDTYFQVIPALSFMKATKETTVNYTLSPQFEVTNNTIKFNHKTTQANPIGSILSKFPIATKDFEFQISVKLSAKSSDGMFFGIFFLNDYKENVFDFNSKFNGFGIVFNSAPSAFEKMGENYVNMRAIKNSNNVTLEDLLYSNDFLESTCKDTSITGNQFKFMARYKGGSLRAHYDNTNEQIHLLGVPQTICRLPRKTPRGRRVARGRKT